MKLTKTNSRIPKEFPVAFDRAELLFGGGFLFPGLHQLVLAEDAGDGVGAARQPKFPLEAFGPKLVWWRRLTIWPSRPLGIWFGDRLRRRLRSLKADGLPG